YRCLSNAPSPLPDVTTLINIMVKILVIEDDTEIRSNLIDLLDLEGYEVIGADNGINGILGVLEHHPDLVLCDVMMPEVDGYDVLRALRQEPETCLIPFIFLTALADKGDIRQGMTEGADDYVTKPFTRREIVEAVEARLQKRTAIAGHHQAEQRQIEALKQEIEQFRETLNDDQVHLVRAIRNQLKDSIMKLNIAENILRTLPHNEQRERGVALVKNVCAAEVKMLGRIPNLVHLSPESQDSSGNRVELV
ncbi:MAG: response regulator, partial [Cyanobacteria bacterium P01_D01_bin.14]